MQHLGSPGLSGLSLVLTAGDTPFCSPGTAEVILRDQTGACCASGWISGPDHWMHFPGLAAFRFRIGSAEVTALPESGADHAEIQAEFVASVAPMVLQAGHGYEVLHGSGIFVPGQGVVGFCAPSGTGKSTIACGLSLRSFPLWADDLIALEPAPLKATATIALPFAPRLTAGSRAYFLGASQRDAFVPIRAGQRASLIAVCVLERAREDYPVEITRLSPGQAVDALLHHAYEFLPGPAKRKRLMVQRYLEICAQIPVFRIRFPRGLGRLPELLDAIQATVIRGKA